MTKHTPGPWVVENVSDRMLWVGASRAERYGLQTVIVGIAIEGLTPEARAIKEANAHLIAAAPDLLAACEHAMRECCDLQGTPAGNAIEAAIAKARGQG
jgi:hypothetical protein